MEWLRKQLKESDSLFDGTLICLGIGIGIVTGLVYMAFFTPIAEEAHAEILEVEVAEEPKEVLLEVTYTQDDIIRKIKETFPEDSETAVKIAKCESGLRIVVQSQHTLSYGQERSFGLFQIHALDWQHAAERLGLEDYRTDINDNLALARHIYEVAGKRWTPWSCYTKGMI